MKIKKQKENVNPFPRECILWEVFRWILLLICLNTAVFKHTNKFVSKNTPV